MLVGVIAATKDGGYEPIERPPCLKKGSGDNGDDLLRLFHIQRVEARSLDERESEGRMFGCSAWVSA